MARFIISQPKAEIARFVAERVGIEEQTPWQNYSALALVDETRILAGVVYNQYSKANVFAHIAGLPGRHWLSPEFLFAMFDYPFRELGVRRITGLVQERNADSQRFVLHAGFSFEGRLAEALPDDDLLVYGMLKRNCRWISDEFCGQLQRRNLRRFPLALCATA